MNLLLLALLFLITSLGNLFADYDWHESRIAKLLPPLDCPLAVEPCIPSDFVAMGVNGAPDARDWTYWGPKAALVNYFNDPKSLKEPILRVRKSETVVQVSPGTFSKENDDLAKAFAPMGLKRMYDVHMNWGKYPIYAITAQFEKKWLYAAWVGLNDPQGTTLMFELVYPSVGKPSMKEFELWNNSLDQTKMLADDVYKEGLTIQYTPGATEVKLFGNKFRVSGEQCFSDKRIQIVIDLQNEPLEFVLDSVSYEFLSSEEVLGGPSARVKGTFTKKDGTRTLQFSQVIPVLVKPVQSFSISATEAQSNGNVVYADRLSCMLQEYLGIN